MGERRFRKKTNLKETEFEKRQKRSYKEPPEPSCKTARIEKMAGAILPVLIYVVIQQLVLTVLEMLLAGYLQTAGARALAFVSSEEGNLTALLGALSIAAGFAAVLGTVRREVTFAGRIQGDRMAVLVSSAGILALSVFLNAVLAGSGLVSSDPSAAAASLQAGRVGLLPGILIYGILSPMAEENVFRGVTLHRLFLLFREKNEEKKAFFLAALLSSLLFGIYHGNIVQGLYAAAMGLCFCWFLAVTQSLAAVAVLHGGINVLTLVLSQQGSGFAGMSTAVLLAAGGIAACCGIFVYFLRKKQA